MARGRWISADDRVGAPYVVVINEALERALWPGGSAIGQCLRVGADTMPCRTIVGVVRNFRVTGGLDDPAMPVYYLPVAQATMFRQREKLFFRPRGDAIAATRAVRQLLQTLEPNLPAVSVRPIAKNAEWLTASLRLGAAAFTAFGVLAGIIGALGLYSVLAFVVVEQRRSYAIRLAIGAAPARLAQGVLAYAVSTTIIGMVVGPSVLLPLTGVFSPLLFRTRLFELPALAAVCAAAVIITIAAAMVPIRTVIRTNAMTILREQ